MLHLKANVVYLGNDSVMYITIEIPVKSHVKAYLAKKYGTSHRVSKKTFLGLLLLELIHKKVHPPQRKKPDIFYSLEIPEYYFNTRGFQLDDDKAVFLSACLERLFMEEFRQYVDMQLAQGLLNAYQSVVKFCDFYEITEDDIKVESLYRNYQRYSSEDIKSKKKTA
jgi:hypothetical protein